MKVLRATPRILDGMVTETSLSPAMMTGTADTAENVFVPEDVTMVGIVVALPPIVVVSWSVQVVSTLETQVVGRNEVDVQRWVLVGEAGAGEPLVRVLVAREVELPVPRPPEDVEPDVAESACDEDEDPDAPHVP